MGKKISRVVRQWIRRSKQSDFFTKQYQPRKSKILNERTEFKRMQRIFKKEVSLGNMTEWQYKIRVHSYNIWIKYKRYKL